MSRTRYLWWGYVKAVIRAFPARDAVMKAAGVTPGVPAGTVREWDAVRRAAAETEALPDGEIRLCVVRAVFWRRSHTLQGAALRWCGGSYDAAKRIQRDFILSVAEKLDLL